MLGAAMWSVRDTSRVGVGVCVWCQTPDFTGLFHQLSGGTHGRAHWSLDGMKRVLATKFGVHAEDKDMDAALRTLTPGLRFDLNEFLQYCTMDEVEWYASHARGVAGCCAGSTSASARCHATSRRT